MNYFKELVNDFKAWRRKEKRVAPRGTRGRVYAKDAPTDPVFRVKKQPSFRLVMRVHRVDGSVEEIIVPAQAQVIQNG